MQMIRRWEDIRFQEQVVRVGCLQGAVRGGTFGVDEGGKGVCIPETPCSITFFWTGGRKEGYV
jgi:hypothetical protein